jgi:hypothetical protein
LARARRATLEGRRRREAAEGRAREAARRAAALALAAGCRVSDAGDGVAAGAGAALGGRSVEECLGMSLEGVGHLVWAFQVATAHVEAARAALARDAGAELLVDGAPYPGPGALGREQLEAVLREAWEVFG